MAQTSTLITVSRTDGTGEALELDPSTTLDTLRLTLTSRGLMRPDDRFLTIKQVGIAPGDEVAIKLSEIVSNGTILIGEATPVSPIDPGDTIARYNMLTDDQRRAIFDNIQIFRGLAVTATGFGKTFEDVYSWHDGKLPAVNMPTVSSEITSDYTFSKVTSDLAVFGSQSASVSLSSSYGSAEADYKTESKSTTTSSKVTEYLVTRYIVRKALLQIDPADIVPTPAFVTAVTAALKGQETVAEGYFALINVLNTWGYYIPIDFALGGVIYATDETQISDFSEAESNSEAFSGSFKATFGSIGGGGAYSNASGSDSATTTSNKFQNMDLQLVGGQVGLEKDYPKWAASLDSAIDWALADTTTFYPTLAILAGSPVGNALLGTAINSIETFSTLPAAAHLQPYLDMQAYNTAVQELVNPFS